MGKRAEQRKPRKLNRKLKKRTKILLIILVLTLALASMAIFAYSQYLHPTGEIIPGVYAIKNDRNNIPMVNFFLLKTGDKYIAIDTGSDKIQTENELHKLNISADDIVAVFITHSHWDHIDSLSLFDNAIIYTGNTENNEFPNISHQIMSDGEIIEITGMSIQCIYTPGHTSDSVCYLIDGKYLFVGDLFVTTNDPPPPNPKRYNGELQLLYREKMLEIDEIEYVFTGHFGLFKDVWFFRWWF